MHKTLLKLHYLTIQIRQGSGSEGKTHPAA